MPEESPASVRSGASPDSKRPPKEEEMSMDFMSFSKEAFNEMIKEMDADGSGDVDKDEFTAVYKKMNPTMTSAQLDAVWEKIDEDGDGNLTVKELAHFYGYSWDGESANEMNDEQILEALQMHAALLEKKDKQNETVKKEEPKRQTLRDSTLVKLETEGAKDKPGYDKMVLLNEAVTLGDLEEKPKEKDEKVKTDAMSLLEAGVHVRFVDQEGKMPLHKLACVQVTEANRLNYKACVKQLIKLQREQCAKEGRSLGFDINHQDKQGKTPLFFAVEKNNTTMIDILFQLEKSEVPDVLLVNSYGSTVLHAATDKCALNAIEHLFKFTSLGRRKLLINTKDKTGRQPLHIAAIREESDDQALISFLIKNGAVNSEKDAAGNVPSRLAEKRSNRASKERIEEMTGTTAAPNGTRGRRASRDSQETLDSMKKQDD